jgi:hypothetical protein
MMSPFSLSSCCFSSGVTLFRCKSPIWGTTSSSRQAIRRSVWTFRERETHEWSAPEAKIQPRAQAHSAHQRQPGTVPSRDLAHHIASLSWSISKLRTTSLQTFPVFQGNVSQSKASRPKGKTSWIPYLL